MGYLYHLSIPASTGYAPNQEHFGFGPRGNEEQAFFKYRFF